MGKRSILIVDDEEAFVEHLDINLTASGYSTLKAPDGRSAIEKLGATCPDLALVDMRLPDTSGIDIVRTGKRICPETYFIVLTALKDMKTTIDAMHEGAFDCISKTIETAELISVIARALEQKREKEGLNEIQVLEFEEEDISIAGQSRAMDEVFKMIGVLSQVKTTVLIEGETGTGKELVARAVHSASGDPGRFVAVNCSAIPETLFESELFGYEKGAFTGAHARRRGRFEMANKGTIFLDEIGETPLSVQAKLLRVIQESAFERIGGEETVKVDLRVIAATNGDLSKMVEEGLFRGDLFYRLNVAYIKIPPLRERREDIPLLVRHIVSKSCHSLHRKAVKLHPDAMGMLVAYDWPGNVRELENVISRAILLAKNHVILPEHLPRELHLRPTLTVREEKRVVRKLAEVEREAVEMALSEFSWHKGKVCDALGISRPRLERLLRRYGLRRPMG
jgi:DNA-binding NtrC family response regulator